MGTSKFEEGCFIVHMVFGIVLTLIFLAGASWNIANKDIGDALLMFLCFVFWASILAPISITLVFLVPFGAPFFGEELYGQFGWIAGWIVFVVVVFLLLGWGRKQVF